MTDSPSRPGAYVRVDDFDMWLEISGSGPPLLLLNGGFASTRDADALIKAFSKHFTVHAFDARGHGRSGFGKGPITYAREAADAVALMDRLGLADAHVFGHSDGGCAALHLLFDYPHRLRSAVLSGTPFSRDCYEDPIKALCREVPLALARGEDPFRVRTRMLAAGASEDKIRDLAKGLYRAWAATPNFTVEMLETFETPVLVIEAGSDDLIRLARFQIMTRTIPGARALSLPNMTHDPLPFAEALASGAAELAASVEAARSA